MYVRNRRILNWFALELKESATNSAGGHRSCWGRVAQVVLIGVVCVLEVPVQEKVHSLNVVRMGDGFNVNTTNKRGQINIVTSVPEVLLDVVALGVLTSNRKVLNLLIIPWFLRLFGLWVFRVRLGVWLRVGLGVVRWVRKSTAATTAATAAASASASASTPSWSGIVVRVVGIRMGVRMRMRVVGLRLAWVVVWIRRGGGGGLVITRNG